LSTILAATLAVGLTACIEDDSADDTTQIEGIAIASGLINGDVEIIDSNGNSVASGKVDAGLFSLKIANSVLDEELTFRATGSYNDSVSGDSITVNNDNALTLIVPASTYQKGQTGNAPITPGSSVISYLVKDGKTIEQAKASFKKAFGYEPNMEAKPFSPSTLDSTLAAERPQADRDAAFRAGAFSQLASELSLSTSDTADLLKAIAEDLSDDNLDGSNGTNIIMLGAHNLQTLHNTLPLATRVLAAYSGFAGSSSNTSGVPAPAANLPIITFDGAGASKTITTDSGRVITISLDTEANPPIPEGFWVSHVNHKITLQDQSGNPINTSNDDEIISVTQHPNMRMITGHTHSTPHSMMTDTSESAEGIYKMDSYYVMPSQVGTGENAVPLGLWSYTVKITEDTDDENDKTHSVAFHPQVKMPMPMDSEAPVDVLFSLINNSGYQWTTMMGATETRPFRVWLHEITPNDDGVSHALTVFISTRDMKNPEDDSSNGHGHMHHKPQSRAMEMGHGGHNLMSFPAVYAGQKLHGPLSDGIRPEHTLSSVTVAISTDGTNWVTMQADGDNTGRFTTASLANLSTNEQNTLSFRLKINDGSTEYEMKTNGGNYGILKFSAPTL